MKIPLMILAFASAALFTLYYVPLSPAPSLNTLSQERIAVPYVAVGAAKILVEMAEDEAAWRKGLSGRESLGRDKGMLFLFPKPDLWRFWMPDMHFPLDIIWIGTDKVAGITPDVPPESNPAAPRFYRPPKPVRYVLEVNAGFAKEHGIAAGDAITFYNID